MDEPQDINEVEDQIAVAIHDQAMAIIRLNRALVDAGAAPDVEWGDNSNYIMAREEASRIIAGQCAGGTL